MPVRATRGDRRRRGERGSVSAQVAVTPAVVALLFMVVQLCLWFYGREVATAAAQHGLDTARVTSGTSAAGEATARDFLSQVGGLRVESVSVSRGATAATATVRADAIRVLPFFDAPITVTLEAPVERVPE